MKPIENIESTNFQFRELNDNIRQCPSCGWRMEYISKSIKRKIMTLDGKIDVLTKKFECKNESCVSKGYMYDPESLALPNVTYGKDIIIELIKFKYHLNLSSIKIHEEFQKRFNKEIPLTTIKRLLRIGEALTTSNIRSLINKDIKKKKFVRLAIDYMEPKSKIHKVFLGFDPDSDAPFIYTTLDNNNEANITGLIKTQADFIKDKLVLITSDADTSLINYEYHGKYNSKNHLCLIHFLALAFVLGLEFDKKVKKDILSLVNQLWAQYKTKENQLTKYLSVKNPMTNLITYSQTFSECIHIINETKSRKNTYYSSMIAFDKVVVLFNTLQDLKEEKLGLPILPIHTDSNVYDEIMMKLKDKVNKLSNFIQVLNEVSTIIQDTNLNKEQTLKSLDKYFDIKDPEIEYHECLQRKRKYNRKKDYICTEPQFKEAFKKKYLKYREKVVNGKDFNITDFTNNHCELSFSAFRYKFRTIYGTKKHSEREYLDYIPYFHLHCNIVTEFSIKHLFLKRPDAYKQAMKDYRINVEYYNRFHNPKLRFNHLIGVMSSEVNYC
jgi:hypothetical protein